MTDTTPRSPDVMRLITSIGSPIALGAALLLYFGWVRSEAQARAFGADASVFEMSAQDLTLRSIDVLFFPLILLLLLWLLALRLHPVFRTRADHVAPVLRFSWVLVIVGLVLRAVFPTVGDVLFPSWVILAIGGTAYGTTLRRDPAPGDRPSGAAVALVAALLIIGLFWQTERLARLGGEALADDLKQNLDQRLPPVAVFSVGALHLAGPDVTETALDGDDGAYRYRYGGLFLLQRSGAKYFLLTDGWERDQGRLVVLPDSDTVRLEFGEAVR